MANCQQIDYMYDKSKQDVLYKKSIHIEQAYLNMKMYRIQVEELLNEKMRTFTCRYNNFSPRF